MKTLSLASLMLLGTLGAFTQAQAADNRQLYNGSYCDAMLGTQVGSFTRDNFGIRNNSNGALRITCPVIVDEADNVAGTNGVWFNTSIVGTSCTLYSMAANGAGVNAVVQSQFAAGGPGWVAIPNIAVDNFWGSYSMICTLPAGGRLNSISIRENP